MEKIAGGTTSDTAVGGMASKIEAAKIAVRSGIPLVIASGKKKDALAQILAGEDEGTLFIAQPDRLQGRKRWIAFFHHPKGTLFVDQGAKLALREKGKSLLPPGVTRCEGEFAAGDVVRSAIWTAWNSPAALRGLIPPPFANAICPRKNWCTGTTW